MFTFLKRTYFQLQIKLLLAFKPVVLFDKINQLDWYQNTLRQWVDDQHFTNRQTILEVGCASGSLTTYMTQSGYLSTGVDFSDNMIELAKKRNHHIDFSVANVLDLPFEDHSFDGVIAASLINIVSDKRTAMQELTRVCQKGGVITILVPFSGFHDEHLQTLQTSLNISGFSDAAMKAWHKLPPKMSLDDLSILFEQAGLKEVITKQYLQGMVIAVSAIKPF